jgi:plastocyanin
MKSNIGFLNSVLVSMTLLVGGALNAAIIVPGANNTDGALVVTENTTIDLSQAVTGSWDSDNSSNAGKGTYDPQKWAVVFKYSSVSVAAGAVVTFKNHPSRAPVVWLVNGNVEIDGTVNLDGQNGQPAPTLSEPGPGGFRGASTPIPADGITSGAGFGVGGGSHGFDVPNGGRTTTRPGSYGTAGDGVGPGAIYGNPAIIPLIGGSGGGASGYGGGEHGGGGAGGGAILISASGSVALNGSIRANGGNGSFVNWPGEGGSGGAIRIVAHTLQGLGEIQCRGGIVPILFSTSAGLGRIRLETTATMGSIQPSPDPSVVTIADGSTALIWPPSGSPEVRVVSIGGQAAPADPRAAFGVFGADVSLPLVNQTSVLIETRNVEQASVVKVRGTPRSNGNFAEVNATLSSVVSEDPLVLQWIANLPVQSGYSAVQVRVIRP